MKPPLGERPTEAGISLQSHDWSHLQSGKNLFQNER